MKVRITYIHDPKTDGGSGWDPAKGLEITKRSLKLTGLRASLREDHLTLSVDELPQKLRRLGLLHVDVLRIRYQADVPSSPPDPYSSRVVPGLHVFYTPSRTDAGDGVAKAR